MTVRRGLLTLTEKHRYKAANFPSLTWRDFLRYVDIEAWLTRTELWEGREVLGTS